MKKQYLLAILSALLLTSCVSKTPAEDTDAESVMPEESTSEDTYISLDDPMLDGLHKTDDIVYQNGLITLHSINDKIMLGYIRALHGDKYDDFMVFGGSDGDGVDPDEQLILLKSYPEKEGYNTVYLVNDDGTVTEKGAFKDITEAGECYLTNTSLLDSEFNVIMNFEKRFGWSSDEYTLSHVEPQEETSVVTVACKKGEETVRTFYFFPADAYISDLTDAKLLDEASDLGLYMVKDKYYCLFDGTAYEIPVFGKYAEVFFTWDGQLMFVVNDGGTLSAFNAENAYTTDRNGEKMLSMFMFTDERYTPNDIELDFHGLSAKYLGGYFFILKDGEIVWRMNDYYGSKVHGGLLELSAGPVHYLSTVHRADFSQIYDGTLWYFTPLPDGRFIAYTGYENGRAVIFDASGELVYISEPERRCLHVGTDYMLMVDADNMVRLYTTNGEQLCEFTVMNENLWFSHLMSGVYEKDGVNGYYFVFSDNSNKNESGVSRDFEYYYIPSTGESGMIDNGYSSFAYAKPVLYLYPTEECDVTVTFAHPERLTTVYPAYNDGWRVTASPDGTLTDSRGRSYYALYWEESSDTPFYHFTDGFCVAGENSAAFLEEKLSALGFTEREANEFIIYWLPIMEANEYNIIRFELTAEREAANALHITPKPDSLLRMAMHIKPSDSPVEIAEQVLPTFERSGFTAVEWGGCVH